ncbi:MAG TPA: hypothetical protein VGG57_09125 [Stellaceae bacterium]|jgi:hypothetical protein
MAVQAFAPGGYRFLTHAFQYSGGVAAEPGFEIVRATFAKMLPLQAGFDAVEAHLKSVGRPFQAFCACELRSPGQFTDQGFIDFNRQYVQRLEKWGVFNDDVNPVARSNVCPEIVPPSEPSLHAFCYTVEGAGPGSFVAAGSGEARGDSGAYGPRTVRLGDQSPDGMREKARLVVTVMGERMAPLGFDWADVTATQMYTVFDIYPAMADEIVAKGAAVGGVTWHYCRPPVQGLDFEMDVRGVRREIVI